MHAPFTIPAAADVTEFETLQRQRAAEVETIACVDIGIIGVAENGRGPLSVPVWYAYAPGQEVGFVTAKASRKARLLEKGRRISLCVQIETVPYKYVSVEGPAIAIEPADLEGDARPLARRNLGTEEGDAYIEATGGGIENALICMWPERCYTADHGKE